jgi:hypothetical protein
MANKFNIANRPKPNQSIRQILNAYAVLTAVLQNNAKIGYELNFVNPFPIAAGGNNRTIVFDCYTQHSSPSFPTIYPLNSQLVNGDLIAGGGSTGTFEQIENDFKQSYAPIVTGAWNQQYSDVNVSNNILSLAIWADQPGTIQVFDPNTSAPVPINNQISLAFPAEARSIYDYYYRLSRPIPQYFIQINNTGTAPMGTQFFGFYLMSYPSFIAGYRG